MTAEANGNSSDYPDEITEKYTISKELGRWVEQSCTVAAFGSNRLSNCSGACGVVRLVFSKGTCQRYAMKVIEKKTFSITGRPGNVSADDC